MDEAPLKLRLLRSMKRDRTWKPARQLARRVNDPQTMVVGALQSMVSDGWIWGDYGDDYKAKVYGISGNGIVVLELIECALEMKK